MKFTAFPIYDMRNGKITSVDPWLLPQDAFETLHNFNLKNGRLEKRKGYSLFGTFVHTNTATNASTNPAYAITGILPYYSGNTETTLVMDTKRVNKYNTTTSVLEDLTKKSIRFKHASKQNWTPTATTVVKGATSGAIGTVLAVIVDTGTFAGNNANGTIIFQNTTITGTFQDGEELQQNGTPANKVGDSDGAASDNEFTGSDSQFFSIENWNSTAYLTNNNNQIQKFNGTYLTKFNIDLDVEGGADNDVNTCKLIFLYKNRLVLLNVTERGTPYYGRARYCDINDPATWPDDNYVDAPTHDEIMNAKFIGEDLIVWFKNSIWGLIYTADPDLPFRWEKIDSMNGTLAEKSVVMVSNSEMAAVGNAHIIGCNSRDVYNIDDKNPEFILGWNLNAIEYCYSYNFKQENQILITYPASTQAKPDKVAVINYKDKSFADYSISSVSVFGESKLDISLTWDDIDEVWNNISTAWNDVEVSGGYPTALFGTRTGLVYKLNDTNADAGSDIECYADTAMLNPFSKEGRQARLSHIDFLVYKDSAASFSVNLYLNSEVSYYKTETVSCEETGGIRNKVWKRVYSGASADFHRARLTNSDSDNRPIIHAIIFYFAPAGRMI